MAYQQVTLAQLQSQLADRVEGKPWWTPAEATRALNNALRLYNAATGFWTTKAYQTTVPDDPWVSVPAPLTQSTRVLFNAVPLEKVSQADLDLGTPNWRGSTTASGSPHPAQPAYWAPVALNLLVIYPADHLGLNTLEVAGVRATPLLVNPADFVDLGAELHDQLLAYAQHLLAFKVGGQVLVASYPGWLNFLKALGAANRQFAATAFYRKVLGQDQQRRLRPPEVQVTSSADQALAAAQQSLQGGP